MMNSLRGGMQVHAVPDDERATDARGQQLPWGYSYADPTLNRKQPVERGPFGRPTSRRATSRSKTATPGPKEDPVNLDNIKTIDDIFGKFKKEQEEKENRAPRDQRQSVATSRIPQAASGVDNTQTKSTAPSSSTGQKAATLKEPSEVLLYGFGGDDLSSAIEFFETISQGRIYEDYDRSLPGRRYSTFLHHTRPSVPRSLPPSAMRKINTYSGGDHWIKVTFDSPEAAERACHYSPHILHGYSVHAEPWRGVGPSADVPIYANSNQSGAGTLAQRRSGQTGQRRPYSTMPGRTHTALSVGQNGDQPLENNDSPDTSETLSSSVTATASGNDIQQSANGTQLEGGATTSGMQGVQSSPQKPLRVRGATRAFLRPHTEAFLPVPPWSQRTFGHIPLIGALFGGDPNSKPGQGGGIIGNAVPRKEDGSFDWDHASMYWRLCWVFDQWLGTDLCGMKGDD